MVPEGWHETTLGALLEFKNGFNTDKSNYGYGTPFINVSEVLKHASLTAAKIPGLVNVTEKEASANAVIRGDILFNRTSETPDEVGFTSVYLDEVPVVFGGFVIRGRPTSRSIHPEFGQYAMRQPMVRHEIIRRSQGAVRSNIGQSELSKVPVHLPPLPEQRKIAEILSTWDQAIEKTESLLANARTQKRALMQNLLTGKRRFPEFEGQPWKEVRLGDLGTTFTGLTGKTKEDFGDGFPFITYLNIFNNSRINVEEFGRVQVDEGERQNRVKLGDIFFTTSSETPNEVGMSAVILDDVPNLFLNSFCFGFRLHDFETLHPRFARFFLRAQDFRRSLHRLAQGATRYNLSKTHLLNTDIELPDIDEQLKIAASLEASQEAEERLTADITKLRTEKKALMQQLLTGKRRVEV